MRRASSRKPKPASIRCARSLAPYSRCHSRSFTCAALASRKWSSNISSRVTPPRFHGLPQVFKKIVNIPLPGFHVDEFPAVNFGGFAGALALAYPFLGYRGRGIALGEEEGVADQQFGKLAKGVAEVRGATQAFL